MYPAVLCTMPLGVPVDPEVYSMKRGASDSTHSHSQLASTAAISSCHHVSRPVTMGHSPASRRKTITESTAKSLLALPSSRVASIWVLSWMGLAPRITASHVTITLDCASARRPRMASGLKPPNTTECTAPMRAHARHTTASSMTMGMYTVTVSPFFTPFFLSTLANLLTCSSTSAYVYAACSSGELPSHRMAVASPRPSATCLSSAL
mmetsp:Transcript_22204/g.35856  ORF Transcript_22204/g.35856 Transcript_22204/m.35856 type:complete len:208 (+) Transcript_22204:1478-2101(+)